jgi:hypothetical protein
MDKDAIVYSRDVLILTLIYHQRADIDHCGCGWSKLGESHAEHVADVFEESCRAKMDDSYG